MYPYASSTTPADNPPQYPPYNTGEKKNILIIVIPIAAVVVLSAAFVYIYFFTSILPFGPNSDRNTPPTTQAEPTLPPIVATPSPSLSPIFVQRSLPGSGGDVRVDGTTEYMFTPDSSGFWELRTSDNGDSDPYLEVYDSRENLLKENDSSAGGENALIVVQLDAGARYSVIAGFYYNGGSGKYTLAVTFLGEAPDSTIPGDGGDVRVYETSRFTFTPDMSGMWEFRTLADGDSDPKLEIFDSQGTLIDKDDDSAGDYNALITLPLDSGNSYDIVAGFYDDEPGSFTLKVTYMGEHPANMPGGGLSGSGGIISVNGSRDIAFSPGHSGNWYFQTADNGDSNLRLEVYDSSDNLIGSDDDGMGSSNAVLNVHLEAGETYKVAVKFQDDDSGSCVMIILPLLEIPSVGGDIRINSNSVILFTPNKSGTWEFFTSDNGDCDPALSVLNSDGEMIAANDDKDGGTDVNSFISTSLNAGETYVILAVFYDGGGSYNLSVNIT